MSTLSDTWFVEPLFDYEYKTYEVMAYVHKVSLQFSLQKFFPHLAELRSHLHNIEGFQKAKMEMTDQLRTELVEVDLRRLQLIRNALPDNIGIMAELDEIVNFAAKALEQLQNEGRKQLEALKPQIEIVPLGVLGPAGHPGYLFVRAGKSLRIYTYHFRWVRQAYAINQFKDVCTHYHSEVPVTPFMNFQAVKWDLIKSAPALRNAYLVESGVDVPYCETLIPIAKEFLIRTAA